MLMSRVDGLDAKPAQRRLAGLRTYSPSVDAEPRAVIAANVAELGRQDPRSRRPDRSPTSCSLVNGP